VRVLVAEDDPVSLLILRRAVEKLGHECLTAGDGEQAWQLYKQTPEVDVIISDWMMPDVDGIELCRRVRDEERKEYTYFIFLTALSDNEHLLMGFEAGADDYLSKPLDREELKVRMVSASRLNKLYRQLTEQREELERLNAQLADQARTDPLTELGNRLRMQEDLESLDARKERYGQTYCVVICDIDFFKSYNDNYGHPAGDGILRRVAAVIKSHCRSGDVAYRYGGEEFLIILPEQTQESGIAMAERLRRAIEELEIPHGARKPPEVITISAGVAAAVRDEEKSIEALLQESDETLYKAKKAGRNCVRPQPEDVKA
jgi:diguanylate cyclase (GGDEF)-like protein